MKPKFELKIDAVTTVNELPESWPAAQCLALLNRLEFEGANELPLEQAREYAAMALQDLEPMEAATALLDVTIGERLSAGKKQNLAAEMTTDRAWEEYPDLSCHEGIFKAQILLNQAYPETPTPEIYKVDATLSALNQAAEQFFIDHSNSLPEALIVRCLASATAEDSILNRLFEDQIASGPFVEAEHIAWYISAEALPPEGPKRQRRKLSLFSPIRWTADLEEGLTRECEPHLHDPDD